MVDNQKTAIQEMDETEKRHKAEELEQAVKLVNEAKIILRYDYPTYRVLGEEAPDEMWEELGRHFGLSVVSSFDL